MAVVSLAPERRPPREYALICVPICISFAYELFPLQKALVLSQLCPAETVYSSLCQPWGHTHSSGHSLTPLTSAPQYPQVVLSQPFTYPSFKAATRLLEPGDLRRLVAVRRRLRAEGFSFAFSGTWSFGKCSPELPEAKFISPGPGGRRDPGDD